MAAQAKSGNLPPTDDLRSLASSELQIKRFTAESCNDDKLRQAIRTEEARRRRAITTVQIPSQKDT